MQRSIMGMALCVAASMLAACGGGSSSSSASAPAPQGGASAAVQGVATPSNVSVVTATQ